LSSQALEERTIGGLHDFLLNCVLPSCEIAGSRAIDLGAGSGALVVRFRALGFDVTAADINPKAFRAEVPFVRLDLNEPDFAACLGESAFDLVTAVEIIEHVESPISFLRNIARLLKRSGLGIVTTPNLDNLPARVKFLLTGKLRMMDERSDGTHISPIFWDLLTRQYLRRAGLKLLAHYLYPPNGYKVTRLRYGWGFRILTRLLPGEALVGDNHVLLLQPCK
jgi:2-polyprenyl-3-methyl-5-hydroxy-6-metoxy-1,4-benzoquinol methylase